MVDLQERVWIRLEANGFKAILNSDVAATPPARYDYLAPSPRF